MKKYVKPDVVFEGFDLSQHIAGGCDYRMNHSDTMTCSVQEAIGEGTSLPVTGLFSMDGTACTEPGGGYCVYNGGNGAMILLIS